MKKTLTLLLAVLAAQSLSASTTANDTATNPAYTADDANNTNDSNPANNTNGWVAGDNGGTGFGAWSFASTGGGGRYLGTTALGANTFGVFAGNTGANTSSVNRPFTGGGLTSGQTFSLTIATTSIANSGEVGINLLNGSTPVFTIKFVGGDTFWKINDGGLGGDFNSTQPFALNTPLNFSFTYNGGQSYSYTFGSASGTNLTATNIISNIDGVRVLSNAQGADNNAGFNNPVVAPEPSTIALLALGSLGAVRLLRRRK